MLCTIFISHSQHAADVSALTIGCYYFDPASLSYCINRLYMLYALHFMDLVLIVVDICTAFVGHCVCCEHPVNV